MKTTSKIKTSQNKNYLEDKENLKIVKNYTALHYTTVAVIFFSNGKPGHQFLLENYIKFIFLKITPKQN